MAAIKMKIMVDSVSKENAALAMVGCEFSAFLKLPHVKMPSLSSNVKMEILSDNSS